MTQENAIVVFEPQNVQQIAQMGPQAANENKVSHDRCIDAGRALLDTVEAEGMSDELDQQVAAYIEKAKKTLKKMNDKRTPVTKLFDTIRGHFTALENDVDPSKKGTIPAQLQEYRNRYAAKKREEEERRRQEILRKQQIEQARSTYRVELTEDYNRQYNALLGDAINSLNALDSGCTLDNYDETFKKIHDFKTKFPDELRSSARMPTHLLNVDECRSIAAEVLSQLLPKYKDNYEDEIVDYCNDILDRLPSKKTELERVAKASAEEAARIKAEMAAREAAEAARREQERREKEEKERAEAELAAKKQEMDGLFGAAQTSLQAYQPKTSVKLRLEVLTPEGFMEVLGMWWSQKGCTMSVEELSKEFKKQITFCNQLANDKSNPMQISSNNVRYVEDVKAK